MTTTTAPLYKRLEALAMQFADQAWKHPEEANSSYLRDHAYSLSEFAQQAEREALADGDSMTAAQQRRIARSLANGNITELSIGYKPFDLPEGWITVWLTYASGHKVYGGISPEGDMHT